MYRSIGFAIRAALLAGALLAPALTAAGENAAAPTSATQAGPVSPEAQAVLDRMTSYLRGLQEFSVESRSSRDEVVEFGYKLQHNERVNLVVARPNQLRADVSGDVSNRSYVFDGAALMIYSADDQAYIRTKVPASLPQLLENTLAAGIEMPLIDVLYQSMTGTLTDAVRSGTGTSSNELDSFFPNSTNTPSSASAMARSVSKMSVLLLLPPMMNSTLACLSQCLKQMRATSFIFS